MMNAASRKAEEQTMEDILHSIRRIMADDHKAAPATKTTAPAAAQPPAPKPSQPASAAVQGGASLDEDIKALRNALNAIRGEMEDVKEELVAQEAALTLEEARAPEQDAAFADLAFEERAGQPDLVSPPAAQAVRQSFASLSQAAAANRELDVGALAETLLRPMLQQWLDAHLPPLVEKLVREEISRLSGREG